MRYIFRAETLAGQGLPVPHQSRKRYSQILYTSYSAARELIPLLIDQVHSSGLAYYLSVLLRGLQLLARNLNPWRVSKQRQDVSHDYLLITRIRAYRGSFMIALT